MKRLGYTINEGGMCYGVAFMAIQAIIRNDINTYVNRLKFINGYDNKLRNYKVINLNPLPEHHDLDTIYINPSNKKYSFHYNKEGTLELITGKLPAEIANEINSISPPLIIPSKEGLKKLKDFFAIELLVRDINKAEEDRFNKDKPQSQQSLIVIDKLLSIKPWLEGIAVYHGLKSPKDLSVEEEAVWNKNFNTWDGDNKPFTFKDYNLGRELFKQPKHSQENRPNLRRTISNLGNRGSIQKNKVLKRSNSATNFNLTLFGEQEQEKERQKDNSIYLLKKHLGLYTKDNAWGLIKKFLINEKPTACLLGRNRHVIAIGGSNEMGYHLIDHDTYKRLTFSDVHLQNGCNILESLFRETISDANQEYAISILVFGVERSGDNPVVPEEGFDEPKSDYWKNLLPIPKSDNAGLLYLALGNGHAAAVTAYINAINSINDISIDKKIELLAAKNENETPGLYMALRKGHAAAVTVYINAINSIRGINIAKKIELLAAKSKDKFPGLYVALRKGHAAAVTAYINAINSIRGINIAKKIELLAAKSKDKLPGLYVALLEGHTLAVTAYINAINNISGINTAKKIELLATKNKRGFPGLYSALQNGHAAAVTAYINAINGISGISLAKKIWLLAAKSKNGTPGLYMALHGFTKWSYISCYSLY
ncbi:hypothetical protein EDC55_10247 [Allofrancisella inopinata]|uniref:Uncharacterized protein n=2 Tax=Allofrancisella inopinata TaxID=1085647 RepID=A0AAE7CQK9_9GAMM|nr:hypothetical protein [Allofrancisella inopinata]QIV95941.1 hypothetical protein E4K63_03495 [Allofrancisella inopinata]TDT74361.1 hypothetical protein EDC55_10247 [Allofrancisella inopinata]